MDSLWQFLGTAGAATALSAVLTFLLTRRREAAKDSRDAHDQVVGHLEKIILDQREMNRGVWEDYQKSLVRCQEERESQSLKLRKLESENMSYAARILDLEERVLRGSNCDIIGG